MGRTPLAARWFVLSLSAALVAGLFPPGAAPARAAGVDPIRYSYDANGRLSGVIDPAVGSAQYAYDAAGNITSIARTPSTTVAILEVSPDSGPTGAQVSISGTGFSATPAQNTVRFNGTNAAVVSSTTTQIIASVPAGATSGSVSVTSPGGSATSATTFSVGSTAPTISGFTPSIGIPGSTLTVTGTNFESASGMNAVRVNSLLAPVTSAAAASLAVTTPPGSSGHVTVTTPGGAATTSGFFFVPPPPRTVADIDDTDSVALGSSASVTVTGGGKDALIAFDGEAGQSVSLTFSAVTLGNTVSILGPDGGAIRGAQAAATGTFFDAVRLPMTGTYTIWVDGATGSTGNLTVAVAGIADASGTVVIGGPAVTQSTTIAGQNGTLTFSGNAGQRVSLQFTNVTYADLDAAIYNPNSTPLRAMADVASGTFFDTLTLPETGTYTLLANPTGTSTGAYTVQVYDVPANATVSATVGGPAVSQATAIPGQNATLTFAGTAGQRASWIFSGVTYADLDVTIYNPDGSVLRANADAATSTFYDVLTLPTTGTYTLAANPTGNSTGAYTVQIYNVPADATGTATVGGPAVSQSTVTPGQNGSLTFAGTAGQRASWIFTGVTYGDLDVTIYNPDGSVLRATADAATNTFYDTLTLPTTGTYTLAANPTGNSTGAYTVQIYNVPADLTGTATIGGAAVSQSTATPGQNASLTFVGTAGQRASWIFTNVTYGDLDVTIYKPDGTVLRATADAATNTFYDTLTLPVSGTYKLAANPTGNSTGSYTVQIYNVPADATGTITVGGSAVTQSTATPGQNGTLTFSGTANQRASWIFTNVTYGDLDVTIYKPDGTVLRAVADAATNTFYDTLTLPTTGTYTLAANPTGNSTGAYTVQIYNVPADATGTITIGGAAVSQSTATPGQNGSLTFTGTANQRASWIFTNVTYGDLDVTILKPDGTVLRAAADAATNTFYDVLTLPVSGTYKLSANPTGNSTGAYTVQIYNVPADATGTATIGGAAVTQSTGTPGQNGSLTFAGTAGQRASWIFTNVTYGDLDVTILKPDGTVLRAAADAATNTFYDVLTLPTTGTYKLSANPTGNSTGAYTVQIYNVPADATATATVGGSAVTQSTATPGQNASLTFAGTAGQKASWLFTNVTYGDLDVTILKPDGSVLRAAADAASNTFYDTLTLPTTGTYTLSANPTGNSTGAYTVQIYNVPADATAAATVGGPAVPVTTTVPGQNAAVTFTAVVNQKASWVFSGVTISSQVSILKPDGTTLRNPASVGNGTVFATLTLPVAGTYTILVNGSGASTGSLSVQVQNQGIALAAPAPVQANTMPDMVLARSTTPRVDAGPADQPPAAPPKGTGPETWDPSGANFDGDWRSGRPRSGWEDQPNLEADAGVTALGGLVLDLRGDPIAGVTLELGDHEATTDSTGRFLLADLEPGAGILGINGATANRPGATYGFFEAQVSVEEGLTTPLPFTIWLPKLDTAHTVKIPAVIDHEIVVTTPRIPGLELHIPAGSRITGEDGQPVTEIGITAIPTDRTPFPLPVNSSVPIYFTIQPGGAYVAPKGAWLVYPNYTHQEPGTRVEFWHFEPDGKGWFRYGYGTVTPDGKQVVPDKGVRIYEFSGAMILNGLLGALWNALFGDGSEDGDPVNLGTGLFVMSKTDTVLPDTMPLSITRTYRPSDTQNRPFGKGMNWNFGIFLWSANQYQEADLILPDSSRVHFVRTSPGTSWSDAIFQSTSTPTMFYRSTLAWNGNGWDLRTRDGTTYVFAENAQMSSIRDRYGNTISIRRLNDNPNGNITQLTSPGGRWITFTYGASNRIATATDNTGRTISYTYNAAGYLWKVTDPASGVTEYTYDAAGQMLTIKDARGITYLTNEYYADGRVKKQTQADGTTFQFAYVVDANNKVSQTDVTDPRGSVRRLTFDSVGYTASDTLAFGTPLAQTTTISRQASGELPTSVTDALGRRTDYAYDAYGNVTTVTRLAGDPDAVTTAMTYDSRFSTLLTVTDPLNHTTSMSYDAAGRLTKVTDPRGKFSTFTNNQAGQPLTSTDATNKTAALAYTFGDLVLAIDPLGNATRRFVDGGGRVAAVTDPLFNQVRVAFDALNRPVSVSDPLGNLTQMDYDANANLVSIRDARGGVTSYTYDAMDRVSTRQDALLHSLTYDYDDAGNTTEIVDRTGRRTTLAYDPLNRQTFAGFATIGAPPSATYESSVAYEWDSANRVVSISDSAAGTIDFEYDGLDRVTSETSPTGLVTYAYDAAGRQVGTTLAGQPGVTYAYDPANRLTSISQGSEAVAFSYDDAGRILSETLPQGLVETFGYDDSSRITSMSYARGPTAVGNLAYGYDAGGRRTTIGGSLASVSLPAAVASASYDADNQLMAWGATHPSYDLSGEMTSDGTYTYDWNARGELTQIRQGGSVVAAFGYDALGRRSEKVVAGTTTKLAFDGSNYLQEQDASGAPTANLLTGMVDQTFRRTDSSGTQYPVTDALGSTVALVDGAGTIQTSYAYEPYGKTTQSGAPSSYAQQFTGRENDGPVYYYRARYLHPTFGRFISEDPIGFAAGGVNLHGYADDHPTTATDPSGRIWWWVAGCAAGTAAYAGSVVLGNIGNRKGLFHGFNWFDAGISCVTGMVGGALSGEGWTLLDKFVIGSVTGFDATLASQAVHGQFDPVGLLVGTAGGGAFSIIPVPGAHEPAGKFIAGGFMINVGIGIGQGGIQEEVEKILRDTVFDPGWWFRPIW